MLTFETVVYGVMIVESCLLYFFLWEYVRLKKLAEKQDQLIKLLDKD